MRTIKFHTRDMITFNFEIIGENNIGHIEGVIRNWNGQSCGMFRVVNESQKGLTIETQYITGEYIELYLANADWHTLQTNDEGYSAYREKRYKHWSGEFKAFLVE